jgi:hypothetical protein
VDTVFQGVGFLLTIIGLAAKRTVVVEDVQIGKGALKLEWQLAVGAPQTPLGVSLMLSGF